MIRAVVIEDDLRAAEHLATLLEDTWQVEVVGTGTNCAASLNLCTALRPDAVFLDAGLPGNDDDWLVDRLTRLLPTPRLVFTARNSDRAIEAFRLKAVDFLLKPLDPAQVGDAVERLVTTLRPFQLVSSLHASNRARTALLPKDVDLADTVTELLPVTGADRDQIQLLARREIVAVVRRERRTWIHTVIGEFATYYPLARLQRWLRGDPFIQVGRHAIVNLCATLGVTHCGNRVCRVQLNDRLGTEITTSRNGAARLAAALKSNSVTTA